MDETSSPLAQPKNKKKKGPRNQTPQSLLQSELASCTKANDLPTALSLYEVALSQNLHFTPSHFNTLLYLCSSSHNPSISTIEIGFSIFDRMTASGIAPSEATLTAVARLAAAKSDGDLAFRLVKENSSKYRILPRLRSYTPALFTFCVKNDAEKAYEVEEEMIANGVPPEEAEISGLLKVSSETGRGDRVYMYLHKLRNAVKCVKDETAEVIERWFQSDAAEEVGGSIWDVGHVREVISRNGGGWHGLGWLGKGKRRWDVRRSRVGMDGVCECCRESLVCVDAGEEETDRFAGSIAELAMEREPKLGFGEFKEWLDSHTEYDAVLDGANIGFYQQNFADGGFNLSKFKSIDKELYERSQMKWPLVILHSKCIRALVTNINSTLLHIREIYVEQLNTVVKEFYERSQKKWPLVILHCKRVRALTEIPFNRELIEEWRTHGALYTTPTGSNDDWYWLYAAVKLKCLLVTNDEMRDHIFELLGSSFFLKWKERHQVRFTFVKGCLKLQMPPSYSTVIQESDKGSWHVPIEGDCSNEELRTWLCIHQQKPCEGSHVLVNSDAHDNGLIPCSNQTAESDIVAGENSLQNTTNRSQLLDDTTSIVTGKRKR